METAARQDAPTLSDSETRVLEVLRDHWTDTCLYTSGVMDRTGLNRLQARRAIKSLVRRGYAELHRGLFDDDGQIAGSGYSATRTGVDAYAALEAKP